MLCRPVFLHWLFSPFPHCFFLSISASNFIRAAFKICAVIFPPLMHSEMVFSLTSSCTAVHLPSIAAASGADCPGRRRRGISQHRAELFTALVQQIAALPFVAAVLAGMAAVRSRTLAHHAFKRIIGKIHRLNLPVQPAAAHRAASTYGKGTSGLSASMPCAAFPPRSHRCAGAGTSGWTYSPSRGVPNTAPTGR